MQTGGCVVELPKSGFLFARGVAAVGQSVFKRNGVIESEAPTLSVVEIEI